MVCFSWLGTIYRQFIGHLFSPSIALQVRSPDILEYFIVFVDVSINVQARMLKILNGEFYQGIEAARD